MSQASGTRANRRDNRADYNNNGPTSSGSAGGGTASGGPASILRGQSAAKSKQSQANLSSNRFSSGSTESSMQPAGGSPIPSSGTGGVCARGSIRETGSDRDNSIIRPSKQVAGVNQQQQQPQRQQQQASSGHSSGSPAGGGTQRLSSIDILNESKQRQQQLKQQESFSSIIEQRQKFIQEQQKSADNRNENTTNLAFAYQVDTSAPEYMASSGAGGAKGAGSQRRATSSGIVVNPFDEPAKKGDGGGGGKAMGGTGAGDRRPHSSAASGDHHHHAHPKQQEAPMMEKSPAGKSGFLAALVPGEQSPTESNARMGQLNDESNEELNELASDGGKSSLSTRYLKVASEGASSYNYDEDPSERPFYQKDFATLLQECRASRKLVILIVAVALLLDNMLLTSVVPIIPAYLYRLRIERQHRELLQSNKSFAAAVGSGLKQPMGGFMNSTGNGNDDDDGGDDGDPLEDELERRINQSMAAARDRFSGSVFHPRVRVKPSLANRQRFENNGANIDDDNDVDDDDDDNNIGRATWSTRGQEMDGSPRSSMRRKQKQQANERRQMSRKLDGNYEKDDDGDDDDDNDGARLAGSRPSARGRQLEERGSMKGGMRQPMARRRRSPAPPEAAKLSKVSENSGNAGGDDRKSKGNDKLRIDDDNDDNDDDDDDDEDRQNSASWSKLKNSLVSMAKKSGNDTGALGGICLNMVLGPQNRKSYTQADESRFRAGQDNDRDDDNDEGDDDDRDNNGELGDKSSRSKQMLIKSARNRDSSSMKDGLQQQLDQSRWISREEKPETMSGRRIIRPKGKHPRVAGTTTTTTTMGQQQDMEGSKQTSADKSEPTEAGSKGDAGHDEAKLLSDNDDDLVISHQDIVDESFEVGVMFASKPIVQAFANPFIGSLTNRVGFTIPMFTGFVIMFLSTLVFAFGSTYSTLFIARAIQGVGSACTSVAGMSMLADRFPDDAERGNAMAIALGGLALGVVIGPPFGGFMYEFVGKSSPFIVLSMLALLDGLLQLLVLQPRVTENQEEGASLMTLIKDPYILVAAGAITFANTGIAILEPALPLWMMDTMQAKNWEQGVAFLPAALSYMFGTNLFGNIGHKIGRWRATMIGLVIIGCSLLLIPFATRVDHLIIPNGAIGFAMGMVDSTMMPMLGYLVDIRHTSVYGSVYAIGDVAFCASFAFGPALSGTLVELIGFEGLIITTAIICFAFAPLLLLLRNPPARQVDEAQLHEQSSLRYVNYSHLDSPDEEAQLKSDYQATSKTYVR